MHSSVTGVWKVGSREYMDYGKNGEKNNNTHPSGKGLFEKEEKMLHNIILIILPKYIINLYL